MALPGHQIVLALKSEPDIQLFRGLCIARDTFLVDARNEKDARHQLASDKTELCILDGTMIGLDGQDNAIAFADRHGTVSFIISCSGIAKPLGSRRDQGPPVFLLPRPYTFQMARASVVASLNYLRAPRSRSG